MKEQQKKEQKKKNGGSQRDQQRYMSCLLCGNTQKIKPANANNYKEREIWLKTHKNHVIAIGTEEQMSEPSYFKTNKKMERIKKNELN